jgi:hypothetical protein
MPVAVQHPVLAPRQDGARGDASSAGYAIAAAAAALVATAIRTCS